MTTLDDLEEMFDDHPSLDASLRDFEPESSGTGQLPRLHLRSSRHSGSHADDSDSEIADSVSGGPYSPPAWRVTNNGMRGSSFLDRRRLVPRIESRSSRERSEELDSADDGEEATLAAALRTRLPTGSMSPEKRRSLSPMSFYPTKSAQPEHGFAAIKEEELPEIINSLPPTPDHSSHSKNYVRFALRAEVLHRTEPFEAIFSYIKQKIDNVTRSWSSMLASTLLLLVLSAVFRTLFQPGVPQAVPDLVKVAGLARAFEPLIFYSENGVQQIGDLQATGVAVWDLGESVRSTNMTSAPIIVKGLDDLSESLKTLSIELTKFFANVDGDVDGILIVMDWAKRELSQLSSTTTPSPLTSAVVNIHKFLSHVGILETSLGSPTRLGALTTQLFGLTSEQRTRKTLQRTFAEFLSILEESINNELHYSQSLFALFESIDRQFLNLARSVIRETDQQERMESDLLASLWTRVLGSNAADLRKFERNKQLLSNVREKTVQNKHILVDHNGKLMTLKANLEMLRKKLVSPLVRSGNSSTMSVEEQIRGLDTTYEHLSAVREKQKGKLMEMLYGAGSRRVSISRDAEGSYEIEGRR